MKRQRGRGRRSGGGNNNPNKHFESNGPDVKIRGSAQQILDKYLQYARDAQTSGDRINAENYLQHAEHYLRLIATMQPKDKPKDTQQDQKSGDQAQADATNAENSGETSADSSKNQRADGEKGERGERGRRRQRPNKSRDQIENAGETGPSEAETVSETAQTSGSGADPVEAVEAQAEDAPAPKPRRRSTRKPKVAAETTGSEEPQDGIMKTLSRGRKPKAASATEETPAPASETTE